MKLNLRKTVEIIVFLCAITTSGSALSTTMFSSWTIPLLILSLGLALLIKPCVVMSSRKLCYVSIWLIIGGLSTVVNFSAENFNSYVHMAIVVVIAMLISQRFSLNEMIDIFLSFMRIVTTIAIFMWLVTDILGINPPLPEVKNFNGAIYQTGIIWNRYRYSLNYSHRIIGFFWEPGLFATYLSIALIIEFLKHEYYRKMDVILFVIAILLTQSSAGYLLLCLVLFIPATNYDGKWKKLVILSLGIFTVIVAVFSESIYSTIIGSSNPVFQKFDFSSGNGASRLLSLQANYSMLLENPLFGLGLAGANNTYALRMSLFGQAAQTSTSFLYAAAFGIFGFVYTLVFILSIARMAKIKKITKISAIILIVIVLNIINKEPHTLFLFTYSIWCYLLNLLEGGEEQASNSNSI